MPRGSPTGISMEEFLSPASLRDWHQNVARGSRVTADIWARSLRLFCHRAKVSPDGLLKLEEAPLHRLLLKFVTDEEARGQAGGSTITHLKAVKSWLSFNGITVVRPVKVRGTQETPTLVDERTPTQDELKRILLAATARQRALCALMAFTGVRPEVLGNYLGDDGLRLKDLPELTLKDEVHFERIPAMVVVRSSLSKARHRYFTFLGEEGCAYVMTLRTGRDSA
jgi:hypothetical protein